MTTFRWLFVRAMHLALAMVFLILLREKWPQFYGWLGLIVYLSIFGFTELLPPFRRALFWVTPISVAILMSLYYKPFQESAFFSMPRPTEFFRSPTVYEYAGFGVPIRAGFAKRDITPGKFTSLAGYYPWHPALQLHDRLWVKSLALEDSEGRKVVLVVCDLIGLLPDEISKSLSLIKNIHPNQVFVSATHTHSGPDTLGIWGWIAPLALITGKNEKYLAKLHQAIAESVDESVANIKDGKLRFATGELVGYANGRDENPPDSSISVMQVLARDGLPITLVNYAAHPDVVQSFRISADYPYYLEQRLKKLIGGETLFFSGAIGGVQPNEGSYGVYFVRRIGEDLADSVFQILKKPLVPKKILISFERMTVRSPLENKSFRFASRIGVISNLLDRDGLLSAEVGRIKIGPAEILTVPGELFPKIWLKAKPKMRGQPNFIFGLTSGEFGYILTPEDYHSGKHPYHVTVSVGPTFGRKIDEALQQLVNED